MRHYGQKNQNENLMSFIWPYTRLTSVISCLHSSLLYLTRARKPAWGLWTPDGYVVYLFIFQRKEFVVFLKMPSLRKSLVWWGRFICCPQSELETQPCHREPQSEGGRYSPASGSSSLRGRHSPALRTLTSDGGDTVAVPRHTSTWGKQKI